MPGKKKGGKKKGGKAKGGGDGGLPPPPDFSQNRQSALEALFSYRYCNEYIFYDNDVCF